MQAIDIEEEEKEKESAVWLMAVYARVTQREGREG